MTEANTNLTDESGRNINPVLAVRCITNIIDWAKENERPIETYMGDTIHVVGLNELLDILNKQLDNISSNEC